jgi:peptidoglycan/LPS O-acetylase OafA/YrhL
LAVFTFLLLLQHKDKYANKWLVILSTVGAKLSTSIYILHPIVITIVANLVVYISIYLPFISVLYAYIAPFAVFIITTIVSWLILRITKTIRTKIKHD